MLIKLFRVSLMLLASHASFITSANITQALQHEVRTEGIWSLPPALAGGEKDKEKFLAIGEANQMVLKFRKPRS